MMRALSDVRLKKIPFLSRKIAAAAYPYHSIPSYDYRYHPDEIGDGSRNTGYSDWRRSYGDEFRETQSIRNWNYGRGWSVEGYPNWGNDLCPHCRETFYPGGRGYAPYWVNGDTRWNPPNLVVYREWNVQPWMTVDYYGNMICGRPYYGANFNSDFYPDRRNIDSFYDHGGRELPNSEYPVNSSWGSGNYPQTCGTHYREHDGRPMPSSRAHVNNQDVRWNDTAARQNQMSHDIYGFNGYDQNAVSRSNVDYNHNTIAESGRLERLDMRFNGHDEYTSRFSDKIANGRSQQDTSSIPTGSRGILQANGPRHRYVTREGDQQSYDRYEWRNGSNQPQSYAIQYPNRSYSENKNGFQKNSTDYRSKLNCSPEAGGQHITHYNDRRNSRGLDYKASQDGNRRRDVKDFPQSVRVKEQPTKMVDKREKPYQSLKSYLQASNESSKHSQQQQPQANSSCDTRKIDSSHQAQKQTSDWDFLGDMKPVPSPSLNAAHSAGGPELSNSGNPVENPEPEHIRGTVEELETFTKEGKLVLAVKVLDVMEKKKYQFDPERDLSKIKMLIRACGDYKAVAESKAVHKHIVNLMSPLKFSIYNKILGMYLKCGSTSDAFSMFYNMTAHNLTSWDTMIKGLVKNNLGEEALDLFAEFKNTDSEPDGPMFLGVFSACQLVGDVIEGMLHFDSMTKKYGIVPSMKHYVSIVDMMGHSGHLDEAMEFIEKMPVKPSVDVWETMMNVCRIHGNTELGDRCAEVIDMFNPARLSEESRAGLISFDCIKPSGR